MAKLHNKIAALAVTIIVVLLNILAANFSSRLDLTFDKRYTPSKATKAVVGRLEDPLTIKAYFTAELPPPYSTVATYTKDLLDEYYAISKGRVRYQFTDPMQVLDAEDEAALKESGRDIFGRPVRPMTKMEQELQSKGIPPVVIRVNEDDKVEERRVYMGLELIYGEEREIVPVVQDVGKLEYIITSLLRKMARKEAPKVALITGHGGPSTQNGLVKLATLLSEQYELSELDLEKSGEIPADIAALAIIGPRSTLSEKELKALDSFILSGKGVAFLLDSYDVKLDDFTFTPINHGLIDLLAHYGLTIEPGIVGDAEGASIGVQKRQGFLIINQPMKYYFMPLLRRYPPEDPISGGLGPIAMAFTSPLKLNAPNLKGTVIAKSSQEAWREPASDLNLDPTQDWSHKQIAFSAEPIPLAITLSGELSSFYAPKKGTGRLALFGNSYFVQDDLLQESGATMMMNTFDWLLGDDELLAMRGRGLSFALLDEDIGNSRRNIIKYGNIFGGPALLLLLGLIIWRRRENKRAKLMATR